MSRWRFDPDAHGYTVDRGWLKCGPYLLARAPVDGSVTFDSDDLDLICSYPLPQGLIGKMLKDSKQWLNKRRIAWRIEDWRSP